MLADVAGEAAICVRPLKGKARLATCSACGCLEHACPNFLSSDGWHEPERRAAMGKMQPELLQTSMDFPSVPSVIQEAHSLATPRVQGMNLMSSFTASRSCIDADSQHGPMRRCWLANIFHQTSDWQHSTQLYKGCYLVTVTQRRTEYQHIIGLVCVHGKSLLSTGFIPLLRHSHQEKAAKLICRACSR